MGEQDLPVSGALLRTGFHFCTFETLPAISGERRQSIARPAALIGAAFFSISLTTNFCRYSGYRPPGATVTATTSLSRSCTEGGSIAAAVASWSFWMMGSGVPLVK